MDNQSQARLLIKILIGVAWLDGEIQPEERQYLSQVVQTHRLAGVASLEDRQDAAIVESLLTGTTKVSVTECEQWIQDYLGNRSIHDDDGLIEAISGLIYSDGDVAISEAKLLVNIQSTPSPSQPNQEPLIAKIQRLYRKAVLDFKR
jgi:hypothetical protein